MLNFSLLFALGATVWMLVDTSNRLQELQNASRLPRIRTIADSNSANTNHPISILNPVNNAMVLTNRIHIEGEAEDGQIISLIINDQIKAVTLPKKRKFNFLDVPIKRGSNSLTVKAIASDGEVTSLETINFNYSNPTVNYLSRNVTRGSRLEGKVAITFDGGYMANVSEEILDVLKEKDLRCTIFLTGRFIRNYPEIVRRMVNEGHEIGNHTWSHPHLTTFADDKQHTTRDSVTRAFLQKELNQAAIAFEACTGYQLAPFWRAPFGEHNLEIREWAAELGYRHIGWTIGSNGHNMDTMDWVSDTASPVYRTSEEILNKILDFGNGSDVGGASGAIIIMHLGTLRNADFPHKKLPDIIDGLRLQGYELVRVSELLN